VQVRDAAGKVVQERTLQAGESLPVAGTPPLAVVLGRADAVEVFVRGQPFAPPAVSKGNVARFEVK
jgi:cytoskeleton protein RodZ